MTEAKPIGEVLPAVTTGGTDLSAPVTRSLAEMDLTVLDNLPARLDDSTLSKVDAIAVAELPALTPCDDKTFAQAIRMMGVLKRRSQDDVSGKVLLRTYQHHLGRYGREAILFLADRATEELDWFPTPNECIAILSRWQRNDHWLRVHRYATARAKAERRTRFDETMTALERRELDQAAIDALPEWPKRIAEERGYLRFDGEGGYVARQEAA